MPHIYINEKDNTVAGSVADNTNVVYIPGWKESGGDIADNTPTAFFNTAAFLKSITGSETGNISAANTGALMARELISLGMVVLYESFGAKGGNGVPASEDAIAKAVKWDKLSDRGLYKVKFLTCGATSAMVKASNEDDYVSKKMLACAAKRGDAIALIDHEKTITASSNKTIAETIYDKFTTVGIKTDENAKYGAAFSPWCKFNIGTSTKGLELPGSFAFLSAFAKSTQSNPNWYAAAGFFRGKIPSIIAPLYTFGDADCAVLQARKFNSDGSFVSDDNTGLAVNPISNIESAGFIIWGNRTLTPNNTGLTASSFLNIRNLCCDVKKTIYKAARKYTFEQNNDILWGNFCSEITPLLDKALSGNGIRGYRLIQRPTTVRGRLSAIIRIIPIEAVEDFDLTVEMTDSLETVSEGI